MQIYVDLGDMKEQDWFYQVVPLRVPVMSTFRVQGMDRVIQLVFYSGYLTGEPN